MQCTVQLMRSRTKKVLITIMALSATLIGSAAIWVIINSRDIPIPDTSDLVPEIVSISDKDNAYTYFSSALGSLYWPEKEPRVDSILAYKTWDDELVQDLIFKNSETISLLKQGLTCSINQEPNDSKSSNFYPYVKWLNMSRLIALKAMYERRTIQTEQSLESCLDLIRLGSLISAHPAGPVDYSVGLYTIDLGLQECRHLLSESQLTEAQMVSISEQLNKVNSLDQGLSKAIKMEFKLVSKLIISTESDLNSITSKSSIIARIAFNVLHHHCFQPNRTQAEFALLCRTMIQNASRSYAEMDLPKDELVFASDIRRFAILLQPNGYAKVLLPSPRYLNPFLKAKCEIQSRLTALRLVIACRIYEVKYGQLPEILENLVPAFIDRVPIDPFDGRPFRYSHKQAIIYSVGIDLKDSGGSRMPVANTAIPHFAGRSENTMDLVYDIHDRNEQ